jgi:hypothetical protein
MRQICADTQIAHRAGEWNAPAHFEGNTVVIVTPSGRTEVLPDADGHYRTGAFHWPGWRAKVIDVLATPSPRTAPHVADALYSVLYETALSSYEVTAEGPGDAAAAVRAHFAATRADGDPDATVQVFDLPAVQLPGTRP